MKDERHVLAEVERRRLRAMVEVDMDTLECLHADTFQLINPNGLAHTREEYLGPMRRGEFRYLMWEIDGPITARVVGDAGAVRYRARLSVRIGDRVIPPTPTYHTDYYERRLGAWEVVFSQATRIAEASG